MSGPPDDSGPVGAKSSQEIIDELNATLDAALSNHGRINYEIALSEAEEKFVREFEADTCHEAVLSDFEFGGILGQGSFGAVYLSRFKDGTIFALKQQGFTENAVSERKFSFALNSPFIVKALYAFQHENLYYIAFECAMWSSLYKQCEVIRASRSEELLKLIAAQIVLALEYLHHCRVVHSDLKRSNVVIFEDGYIKLCDFGLARRQEVGEVAFRLMGKRGMLAPEIKKALLTSALSKDWWDLGTMIKDLLPRDDSGVRQDSTAASSQEQRPRVASESLSDLLKGLHNLNTIGRLGALKGGAKDVKDHAWFSDVDFIKLYYKKIPMLEKLPPDLHRIEWAPPAAQAQNVRW
ncbi:cAMP-dependent protein kinase catalytic subunit alpha-like [Galendromus occidentalis]|uniref:non-specific serine/threonine protein kinase n=1 Tax=Galendromus occidentalis TaxID=34638 RepID=A0AAJ6VYH5_9ACAR|nr:cAMP-dependent protein kinase catalytic subunit alpha-like [Galendromus occidentalis]